MVSAKDEKMKARILVVEADRSTRNDITAILETIHHQCFGAENRAEALALFTSSQEFELTLASITPVKEFEALLSEAKERFSDMQVIVLAGMNETSIALSAIRKGAYDYLLKPIDSEDLLSAVQRALENRRLKLENRRYQTELEGLVTARTEQLRRAVTTLEESYDITLNVLGSALDLKQSEGDGHSKRVTAFAVAIARAIGLPADQIRVIARGAFLHDIGKMAVPDPILLKPGPLDPAETAVMREHCFRGYQLVQNVPFLAEASEIIYCHHENYDGTGYPRKLKGEEIPLGARIVAVANTLDAMTSDRPHRAARSLAEAKTEIQNWSGRQFDPQVARTFSAMPDNIWGNLRKGIHSQARR